MAAEEPVLLFVYNADSGVLHELKDYMHTLLSSSPYDCHLCRVTFGVIGMQEEWKEFIESLDISVEFLHRDEMAELYPAVREAYPAAFIRRGSTLKSLISADEINRCTDVRELTRLVQTKLEEAGIFRSGGAA